jgi:hypothetical protein
MPPKSTRLSDLVAQASALLSLDCSEPSKERIASKLQDLAAELLLEWLVADKRFDSQSQQTEYWLSRFYEDIYSDEQPDAARIYERFNLNLPRSAYLTRLLRARRMGQWRKAAQQEIKTQFGRNKKDAEEAVKAGRGHIQEFDISLSAGAADELRVIYDRMSESVEEKERPRPPKAKPSFGNAKWFGIPADTLLLVLKSFDSEKKK